MFLRVTKRSLGCRSNPVEEGWCQVVTFNTDTDGYADDERVRIV